MDVRSLLQDVLSDVSSKVFSFQIELDLLISWVKSSGLFQDYRIFEDMHHGITLVYLKTSKNEKLRFFSKLFPVCRKIQKTLRSRLCSQNFWLLVKLKGSFDKYKLEKSSIVPKKTTVLKRNAISGVSNIWNSLYLACAKSGMGCAIVNGDSRAFFTAFKNSPRSVISGYTLQLIKLKNLSIRWS